MLGQTLKSITFIGDKLQSAECYNVWFVAGFVFFLLICLVIFNEIKSRKIKELEKVVLELNKEVEKLK